MTVEELRSAYKAEPFMPFSICLADGREFHVPSQEYLMVPPEASQTFVVAQPDGTFRVLDLLLVSSLDFKNGKPPRRTRQQRP